MKKLYIIGAGGLGREVAWIVHRINVVSPTWDLQGYVDDNSELWGKNIGEYPVFGGCDYLSCTEDSYVICAIGNAKARSRIIQQIKNLPDLKIATIIDPNAVLAPNVVVEEGSIVFPGSVITVDVKIGKHVLVNPNCTIGHDSVLEDYATLFSGVNVSGNVTVEKLAEIGTGTQIIQGKRIGKESIVGAGAVVITDIPVKCVAVGVPAKIIKNL